MIFRLSFHPGSTGKEEPLVTTRHFLKPLFLFLALLGITTVISSAPATASPADLNNTVTPMATVTPIATVTGTPPTATNTRTPTRTRTPINTATPTPTPGCNDWRYVSSPTSGQQTNTLYGVSAAAPDDIWAVGNKGQYSSVNLSVMIQHWDGAEWTLLPLLNPGSLRAVDVISSNDVWAVGYTYDPPVQTMIMHWDGTAWNVIPSPNIPGTANKLYAVDAAGPNDVWAVGEAGDQLLVLHWDGAAWSIVPTPQIDLEFSLLNAVAVAGPNDVWAVGTYGNYDAFTLTIHWDGTAWTRSVSPNPGSYRNSLQAVSVVSSNDIWAAGWSSNGNSTFSPTILHWDGTAWTESLVTLPDSPSAVRSPQLFGISAVSSTEAYAVGWAWDSSIQVDIILEWNGTTWTRANPPRISGYYNHLYAVTTVGAGEAWAVGILGNHSSIYVPQILRYGPPCGTPTATVTGTPPTSTPTACGVVNGALTTGDTTLTSHLYRLFPANTCDAPQPYQGTSGAGGSYYYDTYTYPNTTGASTCVSILLNPMTCSGTGGTFIHASAYLNTFDPTNLESNYLGDIGNSPTGPTTFSVTAPAGQSVVVVVNAVVSGPSGACPGYQLTINGHGGCPTPTSGTPTATPLPATSTAVLPTGTPVLPTGTVASATETPVAETGTPVSNETSTPTLPTNTAVPVTPTPTPIACAGLTITGSLTLNDPTQAGRLNTLLDASTCETPRNCPGVIETIPRHYDAYTFVNTSDSTACFTVDVVAACLDEILIHSSSYLGSFDPQNLCQNYLADVGPGILIDSQYSFTVPAGTNFVVVVNELAPNLLCPNYTLTVSGPACPVPSTPAPSSTPILPTITVPPLPTVEACSIHFSDLSSSNTFYNPVMCLSCMGMMSGYADGTFRPNNEVTRGQLAKLVSNTAGFNETNLLNIQSFEDVQVGSVFYMYVERVASRGIISGYPCGGREEPCGTENKPYFRPNANATRGQISKIVSNAARLNDAPSSQTFEDVPPSHTFYTWIERLATHGMMGGYACGSAGEPCGVGNKPYFRPNANATRGQVSKIVGNGFYPDCTMR
jgi:hypothetical protein